MMKNFRRWTGSAIAIALLFSAVPVPAQEGAKGEKKKEPPKNWVKVDSASKIGQEYQLSLRGGTEEKDGTVLLVRVFPLMRRLNGEEPALEMVAADAGACSGRAEVQKGSYTTTLRVPFLRPYEVHVARPDRGGEGAYVQKLFSFDHALLERQLGSQLQEYLQHYKAVADLLAGLESGRDSEEPQPAEMGRRLVTLTRRVRLYADAGTVLTASSQLLMEILMTILHQVSFVVERSGNEKPVEELPYQSIDQPQGSKFDPAPWRAKLDRSFQVALRETVLEALDPLCDLVAAREGLPENPDRARESSIRAFAKLILSVEEGGLKDAYQSQFSESKLPALLRSLAGEEEAAASGAPNAAGSSGAGSPVLPQLIVERDRLVKS